MKRREKPEHLWQVERSKVYTISRNSEKKILIDLKVTKCRASNRDAPKVMRDPDAWKFMTAYANEMERLID